MAGGVEIKDHLRAAHKRCIHNRAEIEKSERCGCFVCQRIFSPRLIEDWCDEDDTALCPLCGIDRNLEIPGSMLSHRPGMTVEKARSRPSDAVRLSRPTTLNGRGNLPRWKVLVNHLS
jgi:hypothetical protein